MTKEEFVKDIKTKAEEMRKIYPMLRHGQAVFIVADTWYAVARQSQFDYKVDCFYDDTKVDMFLDTCYEILLESEQLK